MCLIETVRWGSFLGWVTSQTIFLHLGLSRGCTWGVEPPIGPVQIPIWIDSYWWAGELAITTWSLHRRRYANPPKAWPWAIPRFQGVAPLRFPRAGRSTWLSTGQASDRHHLLAGLQSLYELHFTDGHLIRKKRQTFWRSSRLVANGRPADISRGRGYPIPAPLSSYSQSNQETDQSYRKTACSCERPCYYKVYRKHLWGYSVYLCANLRGKRYEFNRTWWH